MSQPVYVAGDFHAVREPDGSIIVWRIVSDQKDTYVGHLPVDTQVAFDLICHAYTCGELAGRDAMLTTVLNKLKELR